MPKTHNTSRPKIDRLLNWFFRNKENIEPEYIETRAKIENKKHILYEMNVIDSKSSALLTHVSIMLAVLVVLITENDGFWMLFLIFELVVLLFVCMLLLRCVDIMGPPLRMPPKKAKNITNLYYDEIRLRRGIYQIMVRIVIIMTFLLILIMLIKTGIRYV